MSSFNPLLPLSRMNASFDPRDDTHREEQVRGAIPGRRVRIGPLTPEEQAIWEAHEAELGGRHHRIFVARVRARIEGERLELALERLVERHEELRTTLHETSAGPRRRLRSNAEFHLEFVDARRWSEGELEEIVRLTARQPIDLSTSAFRAVLFTRGETDHALLLVAHRIVVGARRLRRILSDLRTLYDDEELPLLSADPPEALRPRSLLDTTTTLLLPAVSSAEPAGESGEAGLHRVFERVAAVAAERPALVDGERLVTYGELDMAANRLARRLRDAGVDPRSCVAVDMPLSAEAVSAHLAILKLGAVSLPCGHIATDDRADALLRAAAPSALVTLSGRPAPTAALPPIVIALDDPELALDTVSSQPLGILVSAEQTAVAALRSEGDSFRAVPLSHAGVTNLLASLRRDTGLTDEDRVLAIGAVGPGELVLDILLPLTAGATLVVEGDEDATRPSRLRATLQERSITRARLMPASWEAVIADGWPGDGDLQALCDARGLTPELAVALSSRVAELRTLYGHLETTLCCASAIVRADGRIMACDLIGGSTLHLLDEGLRPVAIGGVGTVYVGGPGVVRGYLSGPGDHADAFLPDPFSPDGRGLLFRTDDRARRNPDGSLQLFEPAS